MSERPEAVERALGALGDVLARAAGKMSENPNTAPLAEKLAGVLGTDVRSLAAGQAKSATDAAFQAISAFVTDAASTEPERREAATAKLGLLRERVVAAGVPLDELARRVSGWAQEVVSTDPDAPPRGADRLRELMASLREAVGAPEPPVEP